MKLDLMVIDDSLSDALALEKILIKASEELGFDFDFLKLTDPRSALKRIEQTDAMNRMIFVDVMMPILSGIELVPLLREKSADGVLFVLMSSQPGYIKDGYSIEAFDFLCKPFSEEEVMPLIKRAIRKFQACKRGTFNFYSDKTEFKIEYADILYISVKRNYASLVTPLRSYCFRATVKQLLEKLPEQFIQISGNTIVNITRVTSISTKNVILRKDKLTLEISKTYFDHVVEAFKNNN